MIIETFGNLYTRDPISLGRAEQSCINYVKRRIANESTYQSNLIVNLTWFWDNDPDFRAEFMSWVNTYSIPGSTKIYFTAFIDLVEHFRQGEFLQEIIRLGHDISFEGFGENWYSLFPSWMQSYDDSSIILERSPKWAYLSYNRKPISHRTALVQLLVDKKLHDKGWVTFEHGYFPEIDSLTGDSDQDRHHKQDMIEYFQPAENLFTRPEDVRTLGNLDIWNNSYCVVVSETSHTDKWHVSEKTWKPILGMRPYLLNGSPNLINLLHNLGFYSPGDLFNEPRLDYCNKHILVEHLAYLSEKTPDQLHEIWLSQYEMLAHNRRRFQELANEWNFNDYSVPVSL